MKRRLGLCVALVALAGLCAVADAGAREVFEVAPDHPIFDYDWEFKRGKPIQVLPGYVTFLPWQSAQYSSPVKAGRKITGLNGVTPETPLTWTVISDKEREFRPILMAGGGKGAELRGASPSAAHHPPPGSLWHRPGGGRVAAEAHPWETDERQAAPRPAQASADRQGLDGPTTLRRSTRTTPDP